MSTLLIISKKYLSLSNLQVLNYKIIMFEKKEKAGFLALLFSFLIPIVGVIIYLVNKDKVKNDSSYLILALCGFVVFFVLPMLANVWHL